MSNHNPSAKYAMSNATGRKTMIKAEKMTTYNALPSAVVLTSRYGRLKVSKQVINKTRAA